MDAFHMAFGVPSGILWTITYILIIYHGFKDKKSGMPLIALGLNFSWEFLYSIVWPNESLVQEIIIVLWVVFDIVIVVQKFMYGKEEFEYTLPGLGGKLFVPSLILNFAVCFACVYCCELGLPTTADGMVGGLYSSYVMNMLMSVTFITMLAKRGNTKGQSMGIAITKMLGTLAVVLYRIAVAGTTPHPLVYALGIGLFIYDMIYCVLLYKKFKEEGLNPWTHKPLKDRKATAAIEAAAE